MRNEETRPGSAVRSARRAEAQLITAVTWFRPFGLRGGSRFCKHFNFVYSQNIRYNLYWRQFLERLKKKIELRDFENILSAITNVEISSCWRDSGTIFIEFGNLKLENNMNHPHGDYSLMLDFPFEFIKRDRLTCSWQDCPSKRDDFLSTIVGEKVSSFQVNVETNQFSFKISDIKFHLLSNVEDTGSWALWIQEDRFDIGAASCWIYLEGNQIIADYNI